MSTEDKVADVGNRNYIDVLPTEVLCKIFDRLGFKDAKTASLVCKRWSEIISSERFVFYIVSGFLQENENQITELGKVLGQSKRCYRRLKWFSRNLIDNQDTQLVWNAIHPKITVNLHSLELDGRPRSLALIAGELPSMKQLRSLELLPCFYHYNLENPIILRSNSVNHLKATTTIKIRVEMPKLQSFEGSLSSLDRPDENPASLTLSELKHLILCDESDLISITTVQSIFQRLTNLETIKLDYDSFDDEFFDVLCDNCTSLRELTISPNDSGPQNDCSMIRLDLTKLTKLTKLALENSLLDTVNLPKSIRKLKICLSFYNQHEMIQTLIDSSKSLEELQVVFFKAYEETVSLLETLSVLQRLEVLVFYGARFEESSFLHINAPLERVRQLRFVGCKLSTKSFLGIQEKFPNLKKLQFISC